MIVTPEANTNTFQGAYGTSETSFCPTGQWLKMKKEISGGNYAKNKTTRKRLTTKLSPLSFFPVSFKSKTINGHTLIMLLTISISPGRKRSSVSIAIRRHCLECIQSQSSAPFSCVTINSVIENGSRVPTTTAKSSVDDALRGAHQRGIIGESFCVPAPEVLLETLN